MLKKDSDKTQQQMQADRFSRPMSLTVKAVIVDRENEQVLLLKRSKKVPWNAEKWDLPGGHVDEGESVEEAVKREVREETGLEVKLDTVIKVSEFPKESRQFQDEKRGLRYLTFLKEGQNPQKVKLNKREHSEFQWLNLEEAINLLNKKNGFENEKRETLIGAARRMKDQKFFRVGVRAVVVDNQNRVLLLKRSDSDLFYPGSYDIPGGSLGAGEFLEDAVKREVEEEAGLSGIEIGPVIYVPDITADQWNGFYGYKTPYYLVFTGNPELARVDENEHQSLEWLSFKEALEKIGKPAADNFMEIHLFKALKEAARTLELLDSENSWKRAAAELDNFRKRAEKEKEEFRKYATEDLILGLLPVVDNFEASVAFVPEDQQDNPWVTGIMHIKNQLLKTLEERGVEEIATQPGDAIDSNIHEVVAGKGDQVGKILKKGYRLNGKVIRAVSVEAG